MWRPLDSEANRRAAENDWDGARALWAEADALLAASYPPPASLQILRKGRAALDDWKGLSRWRPDPKRNLTPAD